MEQLSVFPLGDDHRRGFQMERKESWGVRLWRRRAAGKEVVTEVRKRERRRKEEDEEERG